MKKMFRIAPYRTYSITELCREFGCTPRALRFYEEQGLLFPRRNQMQRIYSYKDHARLKLIVRGRRVGLSIAEIRKILTTYDEKGEEAQTALALDVFNRRLEALAAQQREIEEAVAALQSARDMLASRMEGSVAA